MKRFFLIAAFFTALTSFSQQSGEEFYCPELKWTIKLPSGFEVLSKNEIDTARQKGAEAIKDTYDVDLDEEIESPRTIFVMSSGSGNKIEAGYTPFDPETDGDFIENHNLVADVMKTTLETQLPDTKVLITNSNETIGGKEFYRTDLTMPLQNGMIFYVHMYSILIEGKDFTVNIMYVNKPTGDKMLESFRASVFN